MTVFIKNYYSSVQQYDAIQTRVFDEGPRIYNREIGINSSSIDTRNIDLFRQGVEITLEKHTLGSFKITAGTPGHIVNPVAFGINQFDIISTGSFVDINNFDPIKYIDLQTPGADLSKVITFPIVTADSNQQEISVLNGIIEPLPIRPIISFSSIEFPYESRAFRGDMMAGNIEPFRFGSDRILTVDYVPKKLLPNSSKRAYVNNEFYLDAFEVIKSGSSTPRQSIGYFNDESNFIDPYVDAEKYDYIKSLGMSVESHGKDMETVFRKIMSGSSENYVPPGKKSGTAGFVYDNIGYAGTDSIAFGGMTY